MRIRLEPLAVFKLSPEAYIGAGGRYHLALYS